MLPKLKSNFYIAFIFHLYSFHFNHLLLLFLCRNAQTTNKTGWNTDVRATFFSKFHPRTGAMLARAVRLTQPTFQLCGQLMRIRSYLIWSWTSPPCRGLVFGLDFTDKMMISTGLMALHWLVNTLHGQKENQTISWKRRNAFTCLKIGVKDEENGMIKYVKSKAIRRQQFCAKNISRDCSSW